MLDQKQANFDEMSIGEMMEEILDTLHEMEKEWDKNKNRVNLDGWRRIRRKIDSVCRAKKTLRKKMIDTEKEVKRRRKNKEEIDHAALIYSA